jgi:hypothetical protein
MRCVTQATGGAAEQRARGVEPLSIMLVKRPRWQNNCTAGEEASRWGGGECRGRSVARSWLKVSIKKMTESTCKSKRIVCRCMTRFLPLGWGVGLI